MTTVGTNPWLGASMDNIKLVQLAVQRSEKFNNLGRQLDPLPSLKDNSIKQSNAEIHHYVRATRAVVTKLRDNLLYTEEEIKSLLRVKENLDKALEHIRKDIMLNQHSYNERRSKPLRERGKDGADDLLTVEKKHLLKLKKVLEAQLRVVQKHLHVLDNARKRLKAVLSERNRVLDLICHAITPSGTLITKGNSKSKSNTSPFSPFTPEAAEAVVMASDAILKSQVLIQEVGNGIKETQRLQKNAHTSVNCGLTQKIVETNSIKQRLQLASGENRIAIHRGNRWRCTTDVARGYTLGPVSSNDLTTRERLDRPHICVFQRHPGTQLQEAQEIIQGNNGLGASLEAVSRNVGMLRLTQDRLQGDIRDKQSGAKVDASIVRNRRRKADHRWVVEGLSAT